MATRTPEDRGHHVEHIYQKTRVGTHAAATLFASEHGLVGAAARPRSRWQCATSNVCSASR